MARSPLRLDRYSFLRSLIEANQEYAASTPKPVQELDCSLSLEISIGKDEEKPRRYQIGIKFGNLASKSGPLPYKIEIEMLGIFAVDDAFEHDELDRIVQVNGASILFGAAREHVLAMTGRGPYGPFMLPTIYLQGEIPKGQGGVAEGR